MLKLYIGKEPRLSTAYIVDAESVNLSLNLTKNNYAKQVLKTIEQAVPSGRDLFIDRLGRGLFTSALSTSSKILLIADQLDCTVRADEMGRNAIAFFLQFADKGCLHFTFLPDMPIPTRYPIIVNDLVCSSDIDFLNAIEEVT